MNDLHDWCSVILQPSYEYAQYLSSVHLLGKTGSVMSANLHLLRMCIIFFFDCPAYAYIRSALAALFQGCPHKVASIFTSSNPVLLGRYLKACFSHRQLVLEHGRISVSALQCWHICTHSYHLHASLKTPKTFRLHCSCFGCLLAVCRPQ